MDRVSPQQRAKLTPFCRVSRAAAKLLILLDLVPDAGLGRQAVLLIFGLFFFLLGRFFNRHVVKLFRIKHIATVETLHKLGVFVAGNDSNPGMFAGGNHRLEQAGI